MATYGMTKVVAGQRDAVREQVTAALKEKGFGVLTRIDMQATLKEKIGVEIEPYEILGACNPHLASQAVGADRAIGLLLPCNVVLRGVEGGVEVSIIDPEAMFSVVEPEVKARLSHVAMEAKRHLQEVLAGLG